MSRIGKTPVTVPAGVDVKIEASSITVKGPKGELSRSYPGHLLKVNQEGSEITVERMRNDRISRSQHGLFRSLINNMIIGVTDGYTKTMKIVGTGYRVIAKGKDIELQVGYSHPVLFAAPEGIEFAVKSATEFSVSGISKELVGETAAKIRKVRPPEPYKGKGIRYVDEYVRSKVGKAGK